MAGLPRNRARASSEGRPHDARSGWRTIRAMSTRSRTCKPGGSTWLAPCHAAIDGCFRNTCTSRTSARASSTPSSVGGKPPTPNTDSRSGRSGLDWACWNAANSLGSCSGGLGRPSRKRTAFHHSICQPWPSPSLAKCPSATVPSVGMPLAHASMSAGRCDA